MCEVTPCSQLWKKYLRARLKMRSRSILRVPVTLRNTIRLSVPPFSSPPWTCVITHCRHEAVARWSRSIHSSWAYRRLSTPHFAQGFDTCTGYLSSNVQHAISLKWGVSSGGWGMASSGKAILGQRQASRKCFTLRDAPMYLANASGFEQPGHLQTCLGNPWRGLCHTLRCVCHALSTSSNSVQILHEHSFTCVCMFVCVCV
jgi:hypothetical protein